METTVVTVKRVQVFVKDSKATVTIEIDKPIKGFAKQSDGTYAEADVTTISFCRSALTAQLCDASDDIALFRAMSEHSFGQKEFGALLFKAELTINREFKAAGELVGDTAVTRDCYLTTVSKVKLTDRATAMLDNALAL